MVTVPPVVLLMVVPGAMVKVPGRISQGRCIVDVQGSGIQRKAAGKGVCAGKSKDAGACFSQSNNRRLSLRRLSRCWRPE